LWHVSSVKSDFASSIKFEEEPPIHYRKHLTAPQTATAHSTPIVINGVIYFGSGDDNLYAIDATSDTSAGTFK